jgi:hypothetical protein
MSEHLRTASEELRAAAEAADGDARQRLHEQSEALADLAARERGPDHGRLARHERAIADAADGAGETAADHADAALEAIHAYRETVEGV